MDLADQALAAIPDGGADLWLSRVDALGFDALVLEGFDVDAALPA